MENFIPVFTAHILKQSDVGNTGIIYQYIYTSKLFLYLCEQFFAAIHIPHISHIGKTRYLIILNFFFCLHQAVFIADAADGYIIAFPGEFNGNGFSDTTGSAGHKYSFS